VSLPVSCDSPVERMSGQGFYTRRTNVNHGAPRRKASMSGIEVLQLLSVPDGAAINESPF
jgi:hypothetical protein